MDSSDTEGKLKAARLINDFQDISFTQIGLICFAAWLVIFVARHVFPYVAERVPNQARLYFLGAVPIIRLLVLTLAILWLIPIIFNVTFQNVVVIAGAASVAIGFAFKDYVSSLIAGVVAIFERPYRPGDWVRISGDYGEVKAVGMRAIKILTPHDDMVTIPHQSLWQHNIANSNDGARTLLCVASFYVAPDHDAARVRNALRDVALTSAYLDYGHNVRVELQQTPWGTHYQVKAYPFDMRDQFAFLSDLTVRGKTALADAGATEVLMSAVGQPLS